MQTVDAHGIAGLEWIRSRLIDGYSRCIKYKSVPSDIVTLIFKYFGDDNKQLLAFPDWLIYISFNDKNIFIPYIVDSRMSVKQLKIEFFRIKNMDISLYKKYELWQWKKVKYSPMMDHVICERGATQSRIIRSDKFVLLEYGSKYYPHIKKKIGWNGFGYIRNDRIIEYKLKPFGKYFISISKPTHKPFGLLYGAIPNKERDHLSRFQYIGTTENEIDMLTDYPPSNA